ncbi:MAG: hypothetical protein MJ106_06010 [Lentisphaeria bacterium]|nr:hypothetical protein [Lentisphaeria bacterium]
MKKHFASALALVFALSLASITLLAREYTDFNIIFDEKEGAKINETAIRIHAAVDEGALVDRTDEFTLEDVNWYKYLTAPEAGKTADDYDYVDEELKIYGIAAADDDVFEHAKYSYFLRISRLYAQEEDTFRRNVKINGVDVEALNGTCYNTGNEFFIKTITNGNGGASAEEQPAIDAGASDGEVEIMASGCKVSKDKCGICGICPIQPLGICLFIWLVVLVAIVLAAIVKAKKK